MAPEIVKGDPYDKQADVWALGCVLYEMIQLMPAFTSSSLSSLLVKIQRSHYYRTFPNQYSVHLIGIPHYIALLLGSTCIIILYHLN